MKDINYYKVLNISKYSNTSTIRQAYRKLAMKHHPDRNLDNKNAENKFKEINEAYEILSDPEKRKHYDLYGTLNGAQYNDQQQYSSNMNFNDVFGDIFGQHYNKKPNRRKSGNNLQYNLKIRLEDAIKGITVKIKINKLSKCEQCNHSNYFKEKTCKACNGYGKIQMNQGIFSVEQMCQPCKGSGVFIINDCAACSGQSRIKKEKILLVKIPKGIDTDDRIKLSNEGESGVYGGKPGDLYIRIYIENHNIFNRKKTNLYCEIPINFITAIIGGIIVIPTLKTPIKLYIPKETQTGKLFRLRGYGVSSIKHQKIGDLFCRILVETPVNLSDKQINMLSNIYNDIKKNGYKVNPQSTSWLKLAKNFFDEIKS